MKRWKLPFAESRFFATTEMSHLPANRSFVVRFSDEADPASKTFNGRVEHLQSGATLHFKSGDDLREFFSSVLEDVQLTKRRVSGKMTQTND
jgi:hypothetical protein